MERSFNFLHFFFFTNYKIHCVSVSKYPCKLMDVYFFSFVLHLTHQKRPSTSCTHPFSTYLPVYSPKFQTGALVGWGIQFYIQRVPTRHTFDKPLYPKNKKYLKKCDDDVIITFFQVFLIFWVAETVKSMSSGYSLDVEFNSTSNEISRSKFE